MKKYLILLASGSGTRFGVARPKQYAEVAGKMVIEHTLAACDCDLFDECVIVAANNYIDLVENLVKTGEYRMCIRIVSGGASRLESFAKGVQAIGDAEAYVVVHNAAQPFVRKETLAKCLAGLVEHAATISGIPSVYVQMQVDSANCVERIIPRERLMTDMGVEGLRLSVARQIVMETSGVFTNLVGKVLEQGLGKVFVYEGDPGNIKITYPEDLARAAQMLKTGNHEH